jgi:hypothetical protein
MTVVTGLHGMLTPLRNIVTVLPILLSRVHFTLHSTICVCVWGGVVDYDYVWQRTLTSSIDAWSYFWCIQGSMPTQFSDLCFLPGFRKCTWLIEWWMLGGCLLMGCLLCVINSSYTFKLTFFKPCTFVMVTFTMCMWLFGSVRTFFKNFTCSWT